MLCDLPKVTQPVSSKAQEAVCLTLKHWDWKSLPLLATFSTFMGQEGRLDSLLVLTLSECFFDYNTQGPRPSPLEGHGVMEGGSSPLRGMVSEDRC